MPIIWSEDIIRSVSMEVISACVSQEPPRTRVIFQNPKYGANI